MSEGLFPPLSFLSLYPSATHPPTCLARHVGLVSAAPQSAPCLSPINKGHAPRRGKICLAKPLCPDGLAQAALQNTGAENRGRVSFFFFLLRRNCVIFKRHYCFWNDKTFLRVGGFSVGSSLIMSSFVRG